VTSASPAAPLLVLLPGLDGTGELFRPLLAVIANGWPTQVVSYPVGQILSYAQLLASIERQIGTERLVVLLAESFSGPLALRFACEHPEAVRAVALCASFVRPPLPRWFGWFVLPFMFRIPPPPFLVRRLMVGRDAPSSLVKSVRDTIGSVAPGVLARRLKDVLSVNCEDALRRCPARIMYLVGMRDVLVRESSASAIRAIRPDTLFRRIEGPHLLLQREPAASWREIEKFLTAIAGF
jgi:pimeloyl-[acyl-carrier protein] methyl ester esterase